VARLDARKLFAVTLICLAIDTGTAALTFTLVPDTFARFEVNDLLREALLTNNVWAYLKTESIRISLAVAVFALAWRFPIVRFTLLLLPMLFLLGASTNIIAMAVFPTDAMFDVLQIVAVGVISAVFLNHKSFRWIRKRG
jgi:hypothetical protein